MKVLKKNKGFTLIELLLVVVIIGLMLAVIVPRAWRANIDTKYGLVRQAASELASFGHEWAEGQLAAQPETVNCAALNYFYTLAGPPAAATSGQQWLPDPAGNWVGAGYALKVTAPETPTGRTLAPEITVGGIVPPEKHPRNPFNGASYFTQANNPGAGSLTPGAIACCQIDEGGGGGNWHYFAFLYQGTDSTTTTLTAYTTYYAGQDSATLAGLRNGMFFVRSR